MTEAAREYSAVILGAGFSGLCAAIRMKQQGIDNFVILEKADRIGGTWRDNTYPGVACDVPSHLYSFSFELNPGWTRAYSSGAEIWSYQEHCVRKYDLAPHLCMGTEVCSASWDGDRWCVVDTNGGEYRADILVSALGGLHEPNYPRIPAMNDFAGDMFHSARWNHDVDLTGKRVGLIGTGSSGVQIAPSICDRVRHLSIFQRTPAWVIPRLDREYSGFARGLLRLPLMSRLYRWLLYALQESWGVFYTKMGSRINRKTEHLARKFIAAKVRDPDLARALTPDFPVGCKRVCISSDYYPIFNRDDVELVTASIDRFEAQGLRTEDGRLHELDTIILATGFQPFKVSESVRFTGERGLSLASYWQERIVAHRTMMVPGFPNLFILLGPNSGLGHNSVLLMIEAQTNYLLHCLKLLRKGKVSYFNPRQEAMEAYNQSLQRDLLRTVFAAGCRSWYKDEQGHNFTLWPHGTVRFWWEMRKPRLEEFHAVAK